MERKHHPLFHALWDLDSQSTSVALQDESYDLGLTLDYPSVAAGGPKTSLNPVFFAISRMYAVGINDTHIVELLLNHGFSAISQIQPGIRTSAMHVACRLERPWRIFWRDRNSPFEAICQLTCRQRAIQDQGGVDFQDDDGNTALHFAAKNAIPPSALEVLLSLGADPNKPNSSGQTPLHIAIDGYRDDIVVCLCKHGGDINSRLPDGTDCLSLARDHLAAEASKTETAPRLKANATSCKQAILDRLIELQAK